MPRKAARLLGSCGNASPRIATPALPAARGHGKVLASGALALTVLAGLVRLSPAEPPIRIGASLARTGQYAALGRQGSRGYELCAKHTNDTGGLLGRRVDLLVEDDQSQPTVAVGIYEQLITREKVDAILGPYSSRITDPVADVSEKYQMPMIAPMAATAAIFKKGEGTSS